MDALLWQDARMNTYNTILFDLDGTLIDSLPDLATSVNAMRRQLAMAELPIAQIRSYIGDGVGKLIHRALTEERETSADKALFERAYRLFADYYSNHLSVGTTLYPGVAETLVALYEQGVKMAVVTNKNEAPARKVIEHFGLTDYFGVILGGDSLPTRKPDPEPLFHAMSVLGGTPETTLMVGDSANDTRSGKAAGCATVLLDYGYADAKAVCADPESAPDVCLSDFSGLLAVVQGR